jgi:hypothetical protein
MKVQPYVLLSVMPRANQKPSFKYFGPFEILEKIGTAAYHQKLPDSSSIHPVVHVSQLKLAAGFTGPVLLPYHLITHSFISLSRFCALIWWIGVTIRWHKC